MEERDGVTATETEGEEGDARIQARPAQERAWTARQGEEPPASDCDRHVRVGSIAPAPWAEELCSLAPHVDNAAQTEHESHHDSAAAHHARTAASRKLSRPTGRA